ncbi:MAG: FtsX-like permease family protein, partial [Chloroflexi bacterium]|nr:FtsX-like permease family protein [Chloroflexota bacterium]
VGVDPAMLTGFGSFVLTSGQEVSLAELAAGEVYINDRAAKELDASPGDELRVYLNSQAHDLRVRGVVERGGIAGRDPTMLLPLERAQEMLDRAGEINLITISNRGDELSGAKLSRDVAQELRLFFNNPVATARLKELLGQERVLEALTKRGETLEGSLKEDVSRLQQELRRSEVSSELVNLLGDERVEDLVMGVLRRDDLKDMQREATTLFRERSDFRVMEVKRITLGWADDAGSFATTFFMIFGLFSIMVGILLIFLIFVLLAAARRSEMGMARAVGAKRRHLVQMFVFEGTAYSLVSSAVGVVLGLAVSAVMVLTLNQIFASFDDGFRLTPHVVLRTVVVSYCLGMAITFATVAVSAYRVSHLNIVAAVRGLPTPIVIGTTPWRDLLAALWRELLRPFHLAWLAVGSLVTIHPLRAAAYMLQALWRAVTFPGTVGKAVLQVLGHFFMQGWLAFLLGLLLTAQAIRSWDRISIFGAGVSLTLIGLGLMLRTALQRARVRPDITDRIAFTSMGVAILVFWALPADFVEDITGELEGDFDVMFASGITMVAAAVWTVMYNADLLVKGLTFITGGIGQLRPVLVTAVAYPMSSRFRTGLTLAMFALVIFTLTVMSVLSNTFGTQFAETETITGGWDIEGEVNFNTSIQDIEGRIAGDPGLRIEDYEAIGGYTGIGVQARRPDGEKPAWQDSELWAADVGFLEGTGYKFKLVADGYGPTYRDVWQALASTPGLAVVGGEVVQTREDTYEDWRSDYLGDVYYQDEEMSPVVVEVREPLSGVTTKLTVIGVLDRIHEGSYAVYTAKTSLEDVVPFAIPTTTYRFKVADGVDQKEAAKRLEAAFLENGMETAVLEERMEQEAAAGQAFFRLFLGFMALGLLVGVAALGVVSTRAVVERRQQIGVLRAIGYRRRMVQLSFLVESSFVAWLGVAIGVGLGLVLSYNAFLDIKDEEGIDTVRYSVPWLQVGVIAAITYVFSLVTTFLPSRQASRIYPAEALRYE